MNVAAISQTLGLIIQLATIITLIYALSKFLHKSSDDIKEWRKDMDDWRKDVDKRFRKGNEHFDQIDDKHFPLDKLVSEDLKKEDFMLKTRRRKKLFQKKYLIELILNLSFFIFGAII